MLEAFRQTFVRYAAREITPQFSCSFSAEFDLVRVVGHPIEDGVG